LKALIFGNGFLGGCLANELRTTNIKTSTTSHGFSNADFQEVDIKNIDTVEKIINKVKPDFVVNCAANTQIDFLEKNPEVAFEVNSLGAENIAKISKKNKLRLIHISTDSVFNGMKGLYSEEDEPDPINIYSKSKLNGEKLVERTSEDYVIIRTNFYGIHNEGKFLFNWIVNSLLNEKSIIGFEDVIFTPMEISNLCKIILNLQLSNYRGLIHVAADELISKYEFAISIAERFNLNKNLIKKGSIDQAKLVAKRPKNTSLKNSKLKKINKSHILSLTQWLEQIEFDQINSKLYN